MDFLTGWSKRDRALAESLIEYESQLHSCGHKLQDTTDAMRASWFEAETVVCGACAAKENWTKNNPTPPPGTVVVTVDTYPKQT